jgi:hypothetical protein
MARSQKPHDHEKERREWAGVREIWDLASRRAIELELSGRKVTVEALWVYLQPFGPEEYRESPDPPEMFRDALKATPYLELVDLRKRMRVIPVLKDLQAIRDLADKVAYLSMLSALEEILLHPEKVSLKEKRQLAKTALDMGIRLKGLAPAGENPEEGSLSDAALDEQRAKDKALAAIPEALRDKMSAIWDEERAKSLRTRHAFNVVSINEKVGHAKTG